MPERSQTDDRTFTLRVLRHDRNEHLLAECGSTVVPSRGEVIQLDTLDQAGEQVRPSTLWRVVSVTLHVPSLASQKQADGSAHTVNRVDVTVLPDVALVPELSRAAAEVLSESRL